MVALGTGFTPQAAESALYEGGSSNANQPVTADSDADLAECESLGSHFEELYSPAYKALCFESSRPRVPATRHTHHRGTTKEPPVVLLT